MAAAVMMRRFRPWAGEIENHLQSLVSPNITKLLGVHGDAAAKYHGAVRGDPGLQAFDKPVWYPGINWRAGFVGAQENIVAMKAFVDVEEANIGNAQPCIYV